MFAQVVCFSNNFSQLKTDNKTVARAFFGIDLVGR